MPPGRHLRGLNPEQARAVSAIEGPLLVLAGAGTGKTRVVTCRIAEMLARGISPRSILALTFTNKAAKEMRERIGTLLPDADTDGMVVSTFHSLGLRLLREAGTRFGYPKQATIADEADQVELVADALREVGVRRDQITPKAAHFRISLWKNSAWSPDDAAGRAHEPLDGAIAEVYSRYEAELRRRGLFDFDDLILEPLRFVEKDAAYLASLRDRWHYLLVDEYQDTNETQYRLLRHLAAPRSNLCVVGDDDQSIYGWRGADAGRIRGFHRDFGNAVVIALEQNYRSTSSILEVANTLIANNTQRHKKRLWSAEGEGVPVELYIAQDEKDEIDRVASGILRCRQRFGQKWEDLAVLFRANRQCRPLEQALRGRQIPYRVVGTSSFFDRREVRDLLSYVRLAANPRDDGAFLRIANTPARGLGRSSIEKLYGLAADRRIPLVTALAEGQDLLPPAARSGGLALADVLERLRQESVESGIGAAMKGLVERTGYEHHVRMTAEDPLELQARLKIVEEVLEMAASSGHRDLGAWLAELALETGADRESKDEDKTGVTLLTMHAAKGLEFPTVWIIGLEETILPHTRSVEDEDGEGGGNGEGIEEERRLFYVGITRARRQLCLSYAKERVRFGRSEQRRQSRFIEELGTDRLKVLTAEDEVPASGEEGQEWLARIRASMRSGRESEAGRGTEDEPKRRGS